MASMVALCFSKESGPVLLKTLYFCDFTDLLSPSGSAHVTYLPTVDDDK